MSVRHLLPCATRHTAAPQAGSATVYAVVFSDWALIKPGPMTAKQIRSLILEHSALTSWAVPVLYAWIRSRAFARVGPRLRTAALQAAPSIASQQPTASEVPATSAATSSLSAAATGGVSTAPLESAAAAAAQPRPSAAAVIAVKLTTPVRSATSAPAETAPLWEETSGPVTQADIRAVGAGTLAEKQQHWAGVREQLRGTEHGDAFVAVVDSLVKELSEQLGDARDALRHAHRSGQWPGPVTTDGTGLVERHQQQPDPQQRGLGRRGPAQPVLDCRMSNTVTADASAQSLQVRDRTGFGDAPADDGKQKRQLQLVKALSRAAQMSPGGATAAADAECVDSDGDWRPRHGSAARALREGAIDLCSDDERRGGSGSSGGGAPAAGTSDAAHSQQRPAKRRLLRVDASSAVPPAAAGSCGGGGRSAGGSSRSSGGGSSSGGGCGGRSGGGSGDSDNSGAGGSGGGSSGSSSSGGGAACARMSAVGASAMLTQPVPPHSSHAAH
eukprot:TRINITY_DN8735_c0_g2_i1.p1 TRINITY_DN8735_c0_g2~~TRINITY_DN8735_c0_g2_i1.p1  ORF type:complete len:501 (-),score=118.31 TRINITY_DN8735_c0_g2_i1:310-1812(-)